MAAKATSSSKKTNKSNTKTTKVKVTNKVKVAPKKAVAKVCAKKPAKAACATAKKGKKAPVVAKKAVKKVEKKVATPVKVAKSAATKPAKAVNTLKKPVSTSAKAEISAKTKEKAVVQSIPTAKAKKSSSGFVATNSNAKVEIVREQKPLHFDFAAGDFVVYPAHGVGQVEGVDVQIIAGMEVTLYTISFEKDRMRVKIPVSKAKNSGLRKLSSKERLKDALATLQGRSQVRRIMWSRRAQEYETKINSGDPVSIAEVLRDLKKEEENSEQSYSERQIYQAALARLAREVAAIEEIDESKAVEKLESVLSKAA